ncbi:MAG: glycogen/starch synthase, partial [Spirochaetaceae bacterium]|nr:glycogen/starch synthase [Spirochaetaceae bacterium]
MKILMISSECVPFAKSGGLADVVAALSRQLSSMGHDVRIILPEYSFLN